MLNQFLIQEHLIKTMIIIVCWDVLSCESNILVHEDRNHRMNNVFHYCNSPVPG
jgi:hypothetical protein